MRNKEIGTGYNLSIIGKASTEGITLVALVITIIVLLILAGITISLTVGQRGILTKAQEAGKNYTNAARYEDEQLATLWGDVQLKNTSNNYYLYQKWEQQAVNVSGMYYFKNPSIHDGNIRANNQSIILQAGITYHIRLSARFYNPTETSVEFGVYDIKNNKFIVSTNENILANYWDNYVLDNFTYTPTEDSIINVAVKVDGNLQYVTETDITINSYSKQIGTVKYDTTSSVSGTISLPIKEYTEGLNVKNNTIHLEAEKSYKIKFKVCIQNEYSWGRMMIYNETDLENLYSNGWAGYYSNYNKDVEYSVIYTTSKDIDISLRVSKEGGSDNVSISDETYLTIEEVY